MSDYIPAISIVVPVYNSADTIAELVLRVERAMNSMALNYELILCDDRSTDKSWYIIKEVCATHKHVIGLRMAKNCGQWRSTLAGISKASSEYIVTIDDDLEYEPADILNLYKSITSNNYQVVFGIASDKYRKQGKNQQLSAWRNKILNAFWKKERTDSFKIFNRKLVFEADKFLPDIPFEAFIVHNLDSNLWGYCGVDFNKRYSGHSNHSFLKKTRLFFIYSRYYLNESTKYIIAFCFGFLAILFITAGLFVKFSLQNPLSLLLRIFIFSCGLLILLLISWVSLQTSKKRSQFIEEQT